MSNLRLTVGALKKVISELYINEADESDDLKRKPGTLNPHDPKLSAGKPRSTGVKQPPSYSPLVPKEKGKSPGWLAVYEPKAFNGLKKIDSPKGRIYLDGPLIRFVFDDPTARDMFWAGVAAKRTVEPGAHASKEIAPAKPHAWRTFDELSQDQKRHVGYVDTKTRGQGTTYVSDEETLGVRPRGGHGGGVIDVDVMGSVPAGTAYVPGRGGVTPSKQASDASSRAFSAKTMKEPDWDELPLDRLQLALGTAERKFKSTQDSYDKKIVDHIEAAIEQKFDDTDRSKERRSSSSEKQSYRKYAQDHKGSKDPKDIFGKRKSWGKTSPEVDVLKISRQKNED